MMSVMRVLQVFIRRLLKTQVQSGAAASVGAALAATFKQGGPAALMRGAGMRVVWIAPQVRVCCRTRRSVTALRQLSHSCYRSAAATRALTAVSISTQWRCCRV